MQLCLLQIIQYISPYTLRPYECCSSADGASLVSNAYILMCHNVPRPFQIPKKLMAERNGVSGNILLSHLQDGRPLESLCRWRFAFFCPLGDEWLKRCQKSQCIIPPVVHVLTPVSLVFRIHHPKYYIVPRNCEPWSDNHRSPRPWLLLCIWLEHSVVALSNNEQVSGVMTHGAAVLRPPFVPRI